MSERFDLAGIDAMSPADFVAAFGDIAEHSPWVAERAAGARPFSNREAAIVAFANAVMSADEETQLALLNAHPDLAGRAAIAGDIGADSRAEQAGAGLDTLSPEEFERFTELNTAYRETFGFPFILAVRGATKYDILGAFEARIGNDRETELSTALQQVCRIMRFRLEDRIVE
jgi:2-oxo-4-hydroxy-4-carboxy-5-ureidoimidazoline decarboxylase